MAAQRSLYEPVSETAAAAAAGLRDGGGLVLDVDADTVGLVSTAKTTKRLRPGIGPRILYRIAACLPVRLRRLLPLLLIGGVYAIIGTLFLFNYTAILHLLQELSTWLKDHGLGGALIVMSLIFATSFPFVPGYGTLATFAGYVYGVPLGFMVSIVSALSGACACFILCRRFGRNYAQRLVNSSPHLDAVLKAVDRRGIKVRIVKSGISLKMFSIATAISLTK
ncbi:hypothetical protein BDF22DRAFT_671346 [Syncephalis plumigaleata]|nr:hypothetical protein BDF22DRAFT_671346 [Syncephalis plumigaleata]